MAPAVDRISDLPKNVIEGILMLLPIRDAMRTSILSRYWRYEWTTLPQLVFEEDCVPRPKDNAAYDGKRTKIVDRVLLLHNGPIRKFKLSFNIKRCGDIDVWILFISRNGIKEFTLHKWEGMIFKVPSCLYLCEELTSLELYRCTIVLPASFKGFSSLTTLDLRCVNFPNNQLEILISICPILKKLVLEQIDGCNRLHICASKLVNLEVDVKFGDICFENTPLLATLSMNLGIREAVSGEVVCKLAEFFGSLPRIERLELSGNTFKILSNGFIVKPVPPKLVRTACQLKYLSINLDFEDKRDVVTAIYIFQYCPTLQRLRIKAFPRENAAIITVPNLPIPKLHGCFGRVKTVEVTDFTGTKSELKFVEIVLASAPVLEKVQIVLKEKVDGALSILTEMIRFPRVSSKAEIVFRAQAAL